MVAGKARWILLHDLLLNFLFGGFVWIFPHHNVVVVELKRVLLLAWDVWLVFHVYCNGNDFGF